jgi:hypothetical protein
MNSGKVKIVNRVLDDLLSFLKSEPAGKYLEALDDQSLPQMSDALLIMVQFESALKSFKKRHYRYARDNTPYWTTKELLKEWNSGSDEADDK